MDESVSQQLLRAADAGDLDSVRTCLRHPECDVNARDWMNRTVLIIAANGVKRLRQVRQVFVNIIQEVLQHPNVDVNASSETQERFGVSYGDSALHNAISWPAAVKVLIEDKRCDVNVRDTYGRTPLMYAAGKVQYDTDDWAGGIQLLMQHPAVDPHAVDGSKRTALDMLLDREQTKYCSFNAFNNLSATLTSLVSRHTRTHKSNAVAKAIDICPLAVCELLLSAGLSPQSCIQQYDVSVSGDGQTIAEVIHMKSALHCAVAKDSVSRVKLLLGYNPDLTVKWRGMTPLELAIAYNVRPEILELLSKDMAKSAIAEALKKYGMVHETVRETVVRLGVKAWKELFNVKHVEYPTYALKGSSSKLIAVNPKRVVNECQDMNTKHKLQVIKQCRANSKYAKVESQRITTAVLRLVKVIANILTSHGLEFDPILAGSTGEDTKVYLPNEVDVMCVLRICRAQHDGSYAYCCKLDRAGALPDWILDKHGHVHAGRLAALFYNRVELALSEIIESGNKFDKLMLFKKSLVLGDKVSRLQLMWSGQEFINMELSVDLALCVRVKKLCMAAVESLCWNGDHPINTYFCREFYCISKTSRQSCHYVVGDGYKFSTSNIEKDILNRLPISFKRSVILAKAVRIASIAKPDEDLSTAFCLAEDVHIDDLISSHLLKSCLIQWSENIHSSRFFDDSPCSVAVHIYNRLRQQLEAKRVESWMGRSSVLLDCADCQVENTCCMKRKLMLAMTCKILQWLQDNEAELADIDYADGSEPCDVKTLAYRRPDITDVNMLTYR